MARHIDHELTDIEINCGVTLDQVAALRPKVLVRDGRAFLPGDIPPALAGSTARYALGEPVTYAGHNQFGHAVYRRQLTPLNPDYPGQTFEQNLDANARRLGL